MKSDSPTSNTDSSRGNLRKLAMQIFRSAAILTVLAFVGREVWYRLSVIDWSEVHVSWPLVALALLFSTVASGMPVVSIRSALRTLTPRVPSWLPLAAVTWLPALGKYVPGKIISVAGGFWMLRMLQVSTLAAGIAMFVLNGLSVLIGLLISLPLAWWPPVRDKVPALGPLGMVLLVLGCICLHPKVLGTVAAFCLKKLRNQQLIYSPRWRDHAVPIIVLTIQFLLQGLTLWVLANAFESIPLQWLPAFVSINALAISIGFLALFAPGGIGVREGILLLALTAATENAVLVVIAMRCVSLLGELILAGLGTSIFFSPIWKKASQKALAENNGSLPTLSTFEETCASASQAA